MSALYALTKYNELLSGARKNQDTLPVDPSYSTLYIHLQSSVILAMLASSPAIYPCLVLSGWLTRLYAGKTEVGHDGFIMDAGTVDCRCEVLWLAISRPHHVQVSQTAVWDVR